MEPRKKWKSCLDLSISNYVAMDVLLFHGSTEGNYLRQNAEAEVRTLAVGGGLKVQTFAVCLHQKSYDTTSAI